MYSIPNPGGGMQIFTGCHEVSQLSPRLTKIGYFCALSDDRRWYFTARYNSDLITSHESNDNRHAALYYYDLLSWNGFMVI